MITKSSATPSGVTAEVLGTSEMSFPTRRAGIKIREEGDLQQVQVRPGIPRSTKTHAEIDSEYISVTLPSEFTFYPFKTLSVRHVRGSEQAKFNRAYEENSMKHVVEAISATLEPGVSAYDLTPPDFYWLMYWQRMNSYTKAPYIHRTYCKNEKHQEKVASGELKPETLFIEEVITHSSLKETVFDPSTLTAFQEFNLRVPVGVATMADLVEILEKDGDAEYKWLADLASYIDRTGALATLDSRIKVVSSLSPDDIDTLLEYSEAVSAYGVAESVTVKCRECGAEMESEVSIDARSFLPSPQRASDT